ncbi:MAG TPA: phosphomannomutase/phosphoglucomutase [Acidimicrobiia bacterium]|nr:phosphomannomutase/phosphoglucomutase [Acidimicrobiia bacterium]
MTETTSANLDAVFKAYDVRGLYPGDWDASLARLIGNAFVRYLNADSIVVGHDMRTSSPALAHAFIEGATLAGADVVSIGLASTDMLYFASGQMQMAGAMITASHNPAEYNGLKLCRASAAPIGEDTGLNQIKAAVATGLIERAEEMGEITEKNLLDDFREHCLSFIDRDSISRLSVVADTANGMGGLVVPYIFDSLDCSLDVLFGELDGTFPNHPADPIQPENLKDLQRRVVETGADVGLAFDGDADRVFLVDDLGQTLGGFITVALVAQALLVKYPGESIVYNLICSHAVPETINASGGKAIRTRVGHSFIKQVMADSGAIFGGEHSGHFYFRDNFKADSGLIAALMVLEVIANSGMKLSVLRKQFETYSQSGEVNSRVSDVAQAIDRVKKAYSDYKMDELDGLTIEDTTWWCNVRPSNTEPLVRLNVEADTQELCDEKTRELLSVIRGESA